EPLLLPLTELFDDVPHRTDVDRLDGAGNRLGQALGDGDSEVLRRGEALGVLLNDGSTGVCAVITTEWLVGVGEEGCEHVLDGRGAGLNAVAHGREDLGPLDATNVVGHTLERPLDRVGDTFPRESLTLTNSLTEAFAEPLDLGVGAL